jgi:hypothetical protein
MRYQVTSDSDAHPWGNVLTSAFGVLEDRVDPCLRFVTPSIRDAGNH